ncbi:gp53 [Escherichia phage phiEB49]|uniref:Gp53 n=1 Tax=Escherichia phage phiEB49 TaxID=1048207 RepID=F8UBW3_9CAUD|nr:virion structural protein [Escherichia phage phiEB49]AEI91253.1 gp53 [Escherichia phage phiEB49]
MAYTEVKAISADSGRFNTLLQAAIDDGFQPVSKITVSGSQSYSVVVAKGADSSITEAKVITSTNMRNLFDAIEAASDDGFTIDTSSLSLSSGQFFAYAYKGSAGGSVSVAWGDVTGKPSTFSPIVGTAANQAMAGNKTLTNIGGVVPVSGLPLASTTAAGAIQIGTGATNAMPGNKFVAGAAVANVGSQTVTGAEAAEVATSATAAVNAVGTKLNDLLAQLRVAKIIAS